VPIDWFTVIAQAINFLILVGLLKYFLYGPVLRTMDRREERIASRFQEAGEARDRAQSERDRLESERSSIEQERAETLREAREEAERDKQKRLENVRQEAVERRERNRKAIESETEEVVDELCARLNQLLRTAMEKALKELARVDLHEQVIRVFADRLESLDQDERQALAATLSETSNTVASAEDLNDEQQQRVRSSLESLGGKPANLDFRKDPELIGGLELRAGGRRIAWTLRDFVEGADAQLRGAMKRTTASRQDGEEKAEHASRE
jgi:F-type H+-transporting ATPase subunit b